MELAADVVGEVGCFFLDVPAKGAAEERQAGHDLERGWRVTSTVHVKSEAVGDVSASARRHRTVAATGTTWKRYTRLAAEYISTVEGSE